MKRALVSLLLLVAAIGARAQTFTVNLPPGGPTFDAGHIAFSGLNGVAVTGQHLLLDFLYPAGIGVRNYSSNVGSLNIWVFFNVQPITPFVSGMQSSGTALLLNGAGATIPGSARFGNATGISDGNVSKLGLLLVMDSTSSLFGKTFDSFGAHFDVTLPNLNGAQITAGDFHIFASSGGGPFIIGAVPENGGTFWLLALVATALWAVRTLGNVA